MKSFARFISRNKLYTAIEAGGMAVALAFIILVGNFLIGQFTCDRAIKEKGDIYVAQSEDMYFFSGVAKSYIEGKVPEIEDICRMTFNNGMSLSFKQSVGGVTESQDAMIVDENFFDFFPFPLAEGDPRTVLASHDAAIISESCARRLFPDGDAIGKTISLTVDENTADVTVTGIFKDFSNTIFPKCEMIYRTDMIDELAPVILNEGNSTCLMFFELAEGADPEAVSEKVFEILSEEDTFYIMGFNSEFRLTPFKKIQFSDIEMSLPFQGVVAKDFIMMFLAAGILLLIFAVLNYTSLTVAQTSFRAKEMATRRLVGAQKVRIVLGHIGETFILTAASFLLGTVLAVFVQPYFSRLVGIEITLLDDIGTAGILTSLSLVALLSVVAGMLPALIISRYKPIDIVRGDFAHNSKNGLSKAIIIIQNVIAISTLSIAIVMYAQLRHMLEKPMGYQRDNIIQVAYANSPQEYFIDELEQLPFVERIGWANIEPMSMGMAGIQSTRNGETIKIDLNVYDQAAVEILGFEIIHQTAEPLEYSIYMSESARIALGETYECKSIFSNGDFPVCGFAKDWKKGSIDAPEAPDFLKMIYLEEYDPGYENFINLKQLVVKVSGDENEAVKLINEFYETKGFNGEVKSYNELFKEHYMKEDRNMKLIGLFTLLTILLSSLGMLAMSTYHAKQHSRNVALQKVYGCSRSEVFRKMIGSFLSSVGAAMVIAVPTAWFIAGRWLENYSWRIGNSLRYYLLAAGIAVTAAFISIVWQTVKLMNTNPVESLKNE